MANIVNITNNAKIYTTYITGAETNWYEPVDKNGKDKNGSVTGLVPYLPSGRINSQDALSRLQFTIPSNLSISQAYKIRIHFYPDPSYQPGFGYSKCFLTKQDCNPQPQGIDINQCITSYYYYEHETSSPKRLTGYISEQSSPTWSQLKNNGAWATFDISNANIKPGETFYIYTYPYAADGSSITSPSRYNNNISYAWTNNNPCIEVYMEFDSYTKPKISSASLSSNSIKRNETNKLTISATNGTNNNIKNYSIYYNNTNSRDPVKVINTNNANTTLTLSNSQLGNYTRGNTVYLWIQAKGSVSGFDSDVFGPISYTVANSSPSAPSFKIIGTVPSINDKQVQITITDLTSSDIDGDSITYHYAVSANPLTSRPTSLIQISNNGKLNLSKSQPYVNIWAKDSAGQYSQVKSLKADSNIAPIINSITCVSDNYINYSGSYSTKTISASASISKTNCSYAWYIITNNKEQLISTNSSISNMDIQNYGQEAHYIHIKLKVTDQMGDSAVKTQNLGVILLPLLNDLSGCSIARESNPVNLDPVWYGSKALINFTLPSRRSNYSVNLSSYTIYAVDSNNKSTFIEKVSSGLNFGNTISKEINISNLNYNTPYFFYIEVSDIAGQIKSINSPNFKRLPTINYNYSFDFPSSWNLYPESQLSYSYYDIALTSGMGVATYEIKADGGQGWKTLVTFSGESTGVTSSKTISALTAFKKIGIESNTKITGVKYQIIVKNAWGDYDSANSIKTIYNGIIDSQAAPVLSGNFYARYGYTSGQSINYGNFVSGASNAPLADKYFHIGDYINFCINNHATDENEKIVVGNTTTTRSLDKYLKKYVIEYSKNNTSWKILCEIVPSQLKNYTINNVSYLGYDYKVETDFSSQNGQNIYFKIYAVDDTNKKSNIVNLTGNMIASRKVNPTLSIEDINITSKAMSVNVSDWGGNNFKLDNFKRSGNENGKFDIYYGTNSKELSLISTTSKKLAELINVKNLIYTKAVDANKKLYFKVVLTVYTSPANNTSSYIIGESPIYVIYPNGPTVSYRSHHLGINATSFEDNEVIKISKFDDRNIIRLVGDDLDITINLDTGKISGAMVDGGTW